MQHVDGKTVFVDLGKRTGACQFNLSRNKPARLPSVQNLLNPHKPSQPPDLTTNASPSSLHDQSNGPLTFFTKIIYPRDPRSGPFHETK